MGLLGFQNRTVSGPDSVDVCGLNGPKSAQNPFKMVGRGVPRHFEWVLGRLKVVQTTKIGDLRSRSRSILKTQQRGCTLDAYKIS